MEPPQAAPFKRELISCPSKEKSKPENPGRSELSIDPNDQFDGKPSLV